MEDVPLAHDGTDGTSEYLNPKTSRSSLSYTEGLVSYQKVILSEQGSWENLLRLS